MTLLRAHRILIAAAIVFFCYYGYWEFSAEHRAGDAGGWIRGTMALLAAGGLTFYFMTLPRRKHPDGKDGGSG